MSSVVNLVALGSRTPVGLRAEDSAAAVCAGVSRVHGHEFMVDASGGPLMCAQEPTLPNTLPGADRLAELLVLTLEQVLTAVAAKGYLPGRLPCWLALPSPRPGFGSQELDRVGGRLAGCPWPALEESGARLDLQLLDAGHAAFAMGIEAAIAAIHGRQAELCLVGGADSYLDVDTLDWLESDRRLMRPGIRGGFPPGEAAAVVALASDGARARLGVPAIAQVRAAAIQTEQADECSAEGLQGLALTEVYRKVAAALPGSGRFDHVYIDLNDERARTTDYGFALLRCGGLFRDGSQHTTSVGQTGEIGAASGAFNSILATHAFARGYASGDHALISSASWNGLRGAVLLSKART